MRQARPSDAPAIARLLREAAQTPGYAQAAPHEIDDAAVALDIAEGLGLRAVHERNGEVVGMITVEPGELASLSRTGRLRMAVRKDLQGKGIGAALMRYAINWAEAGALDRIEIYVRAHNTRAIELYKRFGFIEEGRLRNRILRPDGTRIDDLVMGRMIEQAVI